jgi:hypothetical protein
VTQKATEVAGSTKEHIETLAARTAATAKQAVSDANAQAAAALNQASETVHGVRDSASSAARAAISRAGAAADDWSRRAQRPMSDLETQDKVLLGVAGLAVAAALGLACQRRLSEAAER